MAWGIPTMALAAGILAYDWSASRRLNLLAFPILGMLGWNFVIYCGLAVKAVFPRRLPADRRPPRWLSGLGSWKELSRPDSSIPENPRERIWKAAIQRYREEWWKRGATIYRNFAARILHFGAVAFAAGGIGTLYWRGLSREYVAGWESTFLDASGVHALLRVLLSPAAWLTGMEFPGVKEIARIQWPGGENAGRWIHLYALTALWFIGLPRLTLAGAAWLGEHRRRRAFPLFGADDPYCSRLLHPASGSGASLWVMPYVHALEGERREVLAALLAEYWGEECRIAYSAAMEYGAEHESVKQLTNPEAAGAAAWVIVFSLVGTPEPEVHGALVHAVAARVTADPERRLWVVLDESGFRRRFASQAGYEQRRDRRLMLWRDTLGFGGVRLLYADLLDPSPGARLDEANIIPAASPHPSRS